MKHKHILRQIARGAFAFVCGSMIVLAFSLVPLWDKPSQPDAAFAIAAFAILVALLVGFGLLGLDVLRPRR